MEDRLTFFVANALQSAGRSGSLLSPYSISFPPQPPYLSLPLPLSLPSCLSFSFSVCLVLEQANRVLSPAPYFLVKYFFTKIRAFFIWVPFFPHIALEALNGHFKNI